MRNPRELAGLLVSRAAARQERIALTLHTGAQLVAPFVCAFRSKVNTQIGRT